MGLKRLILLQALGCLIFIVAVLIINRVWGLDTYNVIGLFLIMGIGNIVNAYLLLMRPIEDVSIHDKLTGCHNRVRLEKRIPEYENHDTYAVIFFDINNLKKVNDTHGHDIGDKLLINASDQLRFWFSYGDLYRIGGDEFLVVVPNITETELNKLLDDWYRLQPVLNRIYKDDFDCKFSYGVCFKHGIMSFKDVMKKADKAMYEMKKAMKIER